MICKTINLQEFTRNKDNKSIIIFGSGVNKTIEKKVKSIISEFDKDFPFDWVGLRKLLVKEFENNIITSKKFTLNDFEKNDAENLKLQFNILEKFVGKQKLLKSIKKTLILSGEKNIK